MSPFILPQADPSLTFGYSYQDLRCTPFRCILPQADPSPEYERTSPKGPGYSNAQKWIDSYTMPGQFIGVRLPPAASSADAAPHVAARLYSLASSPYESRRDSAYFDASIIEVGLTPPEA